MTKWYQNMSFVDSGHIIIPDQIGKPIESSENNSKSQCKSPTSKNSILKMLQNPEQTKPFN